MMDVERASAAQRRRGRRLRAALRHERQSIAMALAESQHHTSRGQKKARAGEEGHRNEYEAPRRQKPPPPPAFFRLFDEEDAERGLRPACLAEPRGPQERVQLRTVEPVVVPMVQILDAPVPQVGEMGVDQVVEALQHLDLLIPELVIEVPKISSPCRHCRRKRLPVQQMAEQLVEEPEFVLSVLAIHRQIADIPIPQVGCLSSGGVQGFLPGQDYIIQEVPEQTVDIPAPQGSWEKGGGLQSSLPVPGSTAFCGADHRIVDFPARGDLQGFLPGQGSSASSSGLHDCADDGIHGVFRTFPRRKKSPMSPSSLVPGARQCQLFHAGSSGASLGLGYGHLW